MGVDPEGVTGLSFVTLRCASTCRLRSWTCRPLSIRCAIPAAYCASEPGGFRFRPAE